MRFIILLLCSIVFFSSHASVDIATYERFQKLTKWLEKERIDIEPYIRFYNQNRGKGIESERLATTLYLRACIILENYTCALDRVNELLTSTNSIQKRLQLIQLSIQLNYQLKRYQNVLYQMKKWERSVESLEHKTTKPTINSSHSKQSILELNLITAYSAYHINKWSDAEFYIKEVLKNQEEKKYFHFLISIYQQSKQLDKEKNLLQKLIKKFPYNNKFWLALAKNSLSLNNEKVAITALTVLNNRNKASESQQILLSQLLLKNNVPLLAYDVLKDNKTSRKNKSRVEKIILHALISSRQREKAIKIILNSSRKEYSSTKISLAYTEQNWKLAIKLLEEQLLINPEQPHLRLMKAISHFELQQYKKAKLDFNLLLNTKLHATATQWLEQINYLTS